MRVIVVGGGAAGLAAAHALGRRGIPAVVFEAGPRAGGRIAGDEVDGCRIDTGAQMFSSTYTTTIGLCRELGVPLERFAPTIGFFGKDEFHALRVSRSTRDALRNLGTLRRFLSLRGIFEALRIVAAARRQAGGLESFDPAKLLPFDTDESIADAIRRRGGARALEDCLQNNITSLTLAHPEEVGAAFGMALLWVFVWGSSAELLTPRKGIGAFAAALADQCGQDIRLSSPVERVVIEGGVVRGVATPKGFVAADAVICATTATAALKLAPELPESTRRVLQEVTYSSGCHVVLGADRPVLPHGWQGVTFPRRLGSPIVNCNEGARKASQSAPPGRSYSSTFLYRPRGQRDPLALDDEEIRRLVVSELRPYGVELPDPPRFARVYRWPEAVCLAPGGMLRKVDRMPRAEPPGCRGLFLAGEYLRLPSVEGAITSGIEAAEAATRFLSRSPPASG